MQQIANFDVSAMIMYDSVLRDFENIAVSAEARLMMVHLRFLAYVKMAIGFDENLISQLAS